MLMAAARPEQRRPGTRESVDLLWSALKIRLRLTLRGADSQPWQAALALVGALLPLLMLLLKLTEFLDRGAQLCLSSHLGVSMSEERGPLGVCPRPIAVPYFCLFPSMAAPPVAARRMACS